MNNYNNYYSSEVLNGVTFHLNFICSVAINFVAGQFIHDTFTSRRDGKGWEFYM